KRTYGQIADIKVLPGPERAPVGQRDAVDAGLAFHGRPGAFRRVYRQMKAAAEHAHALDMIAVLMGDEDARKRVRRHTDFRQRALHRAARETGVHQHAKVAGLHEQRVAARAAAQGTKAKRHRIASFVAKSAEDYFTREIPIVQPRRFWYNRIEFGEWRPL